MNDIAIIDHLIDHTLIDHKPTIKALGYKNANATSFYPLHFGLWPQLGRE
jgi:hypothetical protein